MTPQSTEPISGKFQEHVGTGDHDAPYVFGRVPRAAAPFPFSTRELARLMVLRSRLRNGLIAGKAARELH